jgi:MinD-like ATPase involved in chromosome partitioning or flagellar assembly
MAAGVLCAVRGAPEETVVRSLDSAGGGLAVTRRCADLNELLAAAGAGLGRVAVISADLPELDREAVAQLRASTVRVLVLVDPGRPWERTRAVALGAHAVVDLPGANPDADPASGLRVVEAVLALLEQGDDDPSPRASRSRPTVGPRPFDEVVAGEPATRVMAGQVVVVWGPTGSPGRTTLAVNLAAELAAIAGPVVVVDADTYGGTVAQLAGMLDEAPGLAAATRAAANGVLDVQTLARLSPVLAPGLRVLTGISRPDRWPELPASALDVVWSVLRGAVPWTVVDTGFCVEQDEVLSYDTHAPCRNAATLSAIGAADVLVVVGGGDPIGIQRLVRGLDDVSGLASDAGRIVVVNRVRPGAAGPRPGVAIRQALERYAGATDVVLIPDDPAAVDGALLAGRLLREVAPASPARRAIEELAAALATRAMAPEVAAARGDSGRHRSAG